MRYAALIRAEAERDALRESNERLRGLLADIRAEGRITGGIAKRLIAALGEREL